MRRSEKTSLTRRRARLGVVGLGLTALVAAAAGGASGVASASATALPVVYSGLFGFGAHATTPTTPAPGSTLVDWQAAGLPASCHSATHPLPVVLVNGTGENQSDGWNAISPLLKNNGYCVYTTNYGARDPDSDSQAFGDIPTSAGEVATVVDKILAATGAAKVDLVGHSQGGGVLPRWYLKFDGGAAKVDKLVGLAPSNHGTDQDGIMELGKSLGLLGIANDVLQPAYSEQEVGSTVNTTLDAGGDTVPGVTYTTIVSKYDEVVTPYTHQYLTAGPGAKVTNILLQNVCGLDFGEHLSAAYDEIALRLVLNALDPAHSVAPKCVLITPLVGG
jgi:pimeloyl-ACP methyl ester carboxylesterase